ncbi:DUF4174 domain-containing protein [Arenibacter sp. F20364]|uniref:DUF4174 domain-containing protein n=1 Tax=Arenibacter sp. F20364 TaxID=2926415 RepID=UPI001FF27A1D|nr:DUF4174 domain-containing protein [Arenibacter sp. F20364]MCK0192864.1 DUF4174 domain-containing protein [Arenibacter sp. F20364]
MRLFFILIAILIISNVNSQDLKQHRWENRVVLIVAQDEDSRAYQEQITKFNSLPKELKERKIIVYQVLPDRYKLMNCQLKGEKNEWITSPIIFDDFAKKGEEFKVILMGLDGGIKLEKTEVLTTTELFGTIDAMPMRRAEMKNKNK